MLATTHAKNERKTEVQNVIPKFLLLYVAAYIPFVIFDFSLASKFRHTVRYTVRKRDLNDIRVSCHWALILMRSKYVENSNVHT
jgi:hypothetical protein